MERERLPILILPGRILSAKSRPSSKGRAAAWPLVLGEKCNKNIVQQPGSNWKCPTGLRQALEERCLLRDRLFYHNPKILVVLLQGTATSSSTFVGSLGLTFKWKHFWWTWKSGRTSCWLPCQLLPSLRHLGQSWFPPSSAFSSLLLSQWLSILCQNVPGKGANKRTESFFKKTYKSRSS